MLMASNETRDLLGAGDAFRAVVSAGFPCVCKAKPTQTLQRDRKRWKWKQGDVQHSSPFVS